MSDKPLVTFALFAYNQEKYIREAVQGAFAQTYRPLEIILSDDCSTDSTFEIIKEMAGSYAGPHKIILNRNDKNLHIGGHIKKISHIASGDIVIMAAGDDISLPERTKNIISVFQENHNAFAVFSNFVHINDDGILVNEKSNLPQATKQISLFSIVRGGGGVGHGATYAYHHECFFYPWNYPSFYLNEDRLLPLRAKLLGKVIYLPEKLVKYRYSANGFLRTNDPTKVIAKYNIKYMEEISKTLNFAVKDQYISSLKSFLYSKFALSNPRIYKKIDELNKKGNFFNRLQSRILLNIIHFDSVPKRLWLKFSSVLKKFL